MGSLKPEKAYECIQCKTLYQVVGKNPKFCPVCGSIAKARKFTRIRALEVFVVAKTFEGFCGVYSDLKVAEKVAKRMESYLLEIDVRSEPTILGE